MATTSIKKRIETYCTEHCVTIPGGFGRNTPSRYAVIRRDSGTPKLVAKTWFTHEDVAYYVENTLIPELGSDFYHSVDILDFKDGRRLRFTGSSRLQADGQFIQQEDANA